MKIKTASKYLALIFCLLIIDHGLQARQSSIDYDKLQLDIKVLTKVLNTEISQGYFKSAFKQNRVRGSYLEGYGLVFTMPLSSKTWRGRDIVSAKENYDLLKDILVETLASYGDVIKQVKPTDKFVIVATPSSGGVLPENLFYGSASRSTRAQYRAYPFVMKTNFRNIERLANDRITKDQFKNELIFERFGVEDTDYIAHKLLREISIMRGIIEVALEDELETSINSDAVQGVYLDDFGVLFTISSSKSRYYSFNSDNIVISGNISSPDKTEIDLSDLEASLSKINFEFNKYGIPVSFYVDKEKLRDTSEEEVNNAIDKITEVIGSYGNKISDLKNNDKVAIHFAARDYRYGPGLNANLVHTLSYKDIIDYSRNRITLDQLKSRVSVQKISSN